MEWHKVFLFLVLCSLCNCGVLKLDEEVTKQENVLNKADDNSSILENSELNPNVIDQQNKILYPKLTARFAGKFVHATPTYPQYPPPYPYYPGLQAGFPALTPTIATIVTPNGNFTIIGAFPSQFPAQFPGQFPGQFPVQFPGQFPANVFQVNGFPTTIPGNTFTIPTIIG